MERGLAGPADMTIKTGVGGVVIFFDKSPVVAYTIEVIPKMEESDGTGKRDYGGGAF
jgi:hypothetical protein